MMRFRYDVTQFHPVTPQSAIARRATHEFCCLTMSEGFYKGPRQRAGRGPGAFGSEQEADPNHRAAASGGRSSVSKAHVFTHEML